MKYGYVYIMTNQYRSVLYTGVTSNIEGRVYEHKTGRGGFFTSKYKCHYLAYYCELEDIQAAIEREKQIKKGTRAKKIELIESFNPDWFDLAAGWYD